MTDIETPDELIFTTPAKPVDPKDLTAFMLDGVKLHARQPKTSMALLMRRVLANEGDLEIVLGGFEKLLGHMFDKKAEQHILSRLEDTDDAFDVTDLSDIFTRLFQTWGLIDEKGEPVKRAPKSARKRARV